MKTYAFCVAGLALGVVLCVQQGSRAGDKASELQGTWSVVSYEYRGELQKKSVGAKAIFDGDKLTFKDEKREETLRFVLDTTKKPKQINFRKDGAERDKTFGIYSMDGDTLKICFSKDSDLEKDRPTEFVSKKDGGLVLMTLKREKK
jgi:uncharacterized protein (TIGR03067 family)